jgi:hypothetical protein
MLLTSGRNVTEKMDKTIDQKITVQNDDDLSDSDDEYEYKYSSQLSAFSKPNSNLGNDIKNNSQIETSSSPLLPISTSINITTNNVVNKTGSTVEPLKLQVLVLENSVVRYEFLQNGRILRAYDKRSVTPDGSANGVGVGVVGGIVRKEKLDTVGGRVWRDGRFIPLHVPHYDEDLKYCFQNGEKMAAPKDEKDEVVQELFVNGARSLYQQPHPSIYANYLSKFDLELGITVGDDKKNDKSCFCQNGDKNKIVVSTHPVYIETDLWASLNNFVQICEEIKCYNRQLLQQSCQNANTSPNPPSLPLKLPRFAQSNQISMESSGANRIYVMQEMGNYYDAWDVELHANQNMYSLLGHYIESNSIDEGVRDDNLYQCAVIKIYYHMYNEPYLNLTGGNGKKYFEMIKFDGENNDKNGQIDCGKINNVNFDNNFNILNPIFNSLELHPLNSFTFTSTSSNISSLSAPLTHNVPNVATSTSYYHHIVQTVTLFPSTHLLKFQLLIDNSSSNHKMLRTSFPAHIISQSRVLYDVQGGYIDRSTTTTNNSFNIAQFEVCAQKWCLIQEAMTSLLTLPQSNQLSIALQTHTGQHGFSAVNNTILLSLLRSPKRPDNYCDNHIHNLGYQIGSYLPGIVDGGNKKRDLYYTQSTQKLALQTSVLTQVTHEALILSTPIIMMPLVSQSRSVGANISYIGTTTPNVLVTSVKMAENSIVTQKSLVVMDRGCGDFGIGGKDLKGNRLGRYLGKIAQNYSKNVPNKNDEKTTSLFPTITTFNPYISFTNTIVVRIVETTGISSYGSLWFNNDVFDLSKAKIYVSNILEYSSEQQLSNPIKPVLVEWEGGKVWKVPFVLGAFKFQTFVIHLLGQ